MRKLKDVIALLGLCSFATQTYSKQSYGKLFEQYLKNFQDSKWAEFYDYKVFVSNM